MVIVVSDVETIVTGTGLCTTDDTVTGGGVDVIVKDTVETTTDVSVLTNVTGGCTMVTNEIDSTVVGLATVSVVVVGVGTSEVYVLVKVSKTVVV
jgi:hypothetical protein